MDKSAEGGLKSVGNTMGVRNNPPKNREQLQKFPLNLHLQKFPLNLKFLYATVPRLSKPQIGVHYITGLNILRKILPITFHATDDMW